ncbi:hypothetical protein BDV18DRAFT_134244 [Aspergillus unguis]
MNFSWLATLALIGTAMAIPGGQGGGKLPSGATCEKSGKGGICQSGLCIQDVNANQGKCK